LPSVIVVGVGNVVRQNVERAGLVEPDAELLIEGVDEREVSLALPPDHLGGSGLLKLQGLLEDLDGAGVNSGCVIHCIRAQDLVFIALAPDVILDFEQAV